MLNASYHVLLLNWLLGQSLPILLPQAYTCGLYLKVLMDNIECCSEIGWNPIMTFILLILVVRLLSCGNMSFMGDSAQKLLHDYKCFTQHWHWASQAWRLKFQECVSIYYYNICSTKILGYVLEIKVTNTVSDIWKSHFSINFRLHCI